MITARTRLPRPDARQSQARYRLLDSPFGTFILIQTADGGLRTGWVGQGCRVDPDVMREDQRLLPEVTRRLQRYFDGQTVDFSDLPLPGGTTFSRRCWHACRKIPRGETISYGQLARRAVGTTAASRAAGQAMRHNPAPIIIPCHRVISANGRLHGFAGSVDPCGQQLDLKRRLLELEGAMPTLPHV
jgi:methylated-DNA-[protein]-cysteine S-methyltransferase